jgi:hypothetical protein
MYNRYVDHLRHEGVRCREQYEEGEPLSFLYCECNPEKLSQLPFFEFLAEGLTFDLEYLDIKFSLDPQALFSYNIYTHLGSNQECEVMLKADSRSTNTWTLGAPFMTSHFTIYDLEMNRLGLLPLEVSKLVAQPNVLASLPIVDSIDEAEALSR